MLDTTQLLSSHLVFAVNFFPEKNTFPIIWLSFPFHLAREMVSIRRKFPWGYLARRQKPDFKRLQKDRITYAPRPLPEHRPRPLSCPPPAKSSQLWNPFKKPQQTFDSDQSLFSRLPPEIRRLIWFKVLGGRLLHIARVSKKLLAVDCVDAFGPEIYTRDHSCWGVTPRHITNPTPGYHFSSGPRHKQQSMLPLLQICRMIYVEAIPILYGDNTLDINHLDTVLYLRQSVLPQRLNQIRVLNFTWCFRWNTASTPVPWDFATWHETCDILARFLGLQELTMHLDGPHLGGSELNALSLKISADKREKKRDTHSG